MSSFTVNNQNAGTPQNLSSSYKTILVGTAATGGTTLRRGWITETRFGANAVPNATDCQIEYDMSIQTAAGTATSLTPLVTDIGGGDAAALLTWAANATAEGTITSSTSQFNKAINQRASDKQWWRDKATCPIIPAVNLKGIAFRALSPNYAAPVTWDANVEE
jgi:hypothetical protein